MVPKPLAVAYGFKRRFRAVLFRMVPKHAILICLLQLGFRAVLFRMVPKRYWMGQV